jgi:uncharacterized membrane protein
MGGMYNRNPRFTLSDAFVITAFAIIHYVVGLAFAWMTFWPWQIVSILGWILVNIWWFPVQQIYQLLHSDNYISRLVFPVCNSLLWGAVVFVIWKARQGQYYRFTLRTLLISTTLVSVVLGLIACIQAAIK